MLKLKNLMRILIVATFFGIIFYYTTTEPETVPLKGPNPQAVPATEIKNDALNVIERPTSGISTYIGKNIEEIMVDFGAPSRIDPSPFKYSWWVYVRDQQFIMFGVQDEIINQVYTNSPIIDVTPYKINQMLEDIYRMTIVENEITVTQDDSTYIFIMNENDMKERVLVAFDEIYAQLYVDQVTNQLAGVRFISGEVLMQHQPYEYQYIGNVVQPNVPSSFEQMEIDTAHASQLYNLVNDFRMKQNVGKLLRSPMYDSIARDHSEYLVTQNLQSNTEQEEMTISDRLKENNLETKGVEVNIAVDYYDAIEAFHGWINSKSHREILLNKKFNVSGSGVYLNTYTQIYYEKEIPGFIE